MHNFPSRYLDTSITMPRRSTRSTVHGKFLRPASNQQGRPSSSSTPFVVDENVDRKVQAQQGMAAEGSPEKGFFINLNIEDQLDDVDHGERGKMGDIIKKAVEAAVKAAIPAIVKAVKDVCLNAVKEEINPHLLRMQYSLDEKEQYSRRDNLRVSGLPESDGEETEEQLLSKVCGVASKAGVEVEARDISACHRLGKKADGKTRQTIVRFSLRRKRDSLYASRFSLKGKEGCRNIYINEDLTAMRHSVLMKAKESPLVKSVSTKHGSIICKLNSDETKIISTPDGLFDVGLDNIDYTRFKLHLLQ